MSRDQETLPAPEPEAQALSERLQARIGEEIEAAGGVIGFDRYMELALYAPGLGYYSAGLTKFGAAGDFTTAPLVSPLFSRVLARQCAQVLEALGGGDILELGAGSGRMAVDLLRELMELNRLPERYLILEVSASLRQWQQELIEAELPELRERVQWLDQLPETPLRGVILGNEVLDALPVQRFRIGEDGPEELGVAIGPEGFAWRGRPASAALQAALDEIEQDCGRRLPVGYSSECCPRLEPWLGSLADALAAGVILLIDYGYPRGEYYHPQRHMGTLVCHYRHRAHDDPLMLVGLQDITAFVDFSAVAAGGVAAGLELLGFTPQAQFLLGAGLPQLLAAELEGLDEVQQVRLTQQAKALTLPEEMGERFKVIAFGADFEQPLAGFALADHTRRL